MASSRTFGDGLFVVGEADKASTSTLFDLSERSWDDTSSNDTVGEVYAEEAIPGLGDHSPRMMW